MGKDGDDLMRRSVFVKYASLLIMLSSLVRFFFGIMMINFFSTSLTFGAVSRETVGLASVNLGVIILGALAELIAGFTGMLNWEEPLKAKNCVIWGVIALVLGLAGNMMQHFTGYGISEVAWTTGCIIPGVFLTAALLFYLKR